MNLVLTTYMHEDCMIYQLTPSIKAMYRHHNFPNHPTTLTHRLAMQISVLCKVHRMELLTLLLAYTAAVANAGPLAYATCQAACAAGCAACGGVSGGLCFVPCYAVCQQGCVAALLAPTP
jgi:hypothetical protein